MITKSEGIGCILLIVGMVFTFIFSIENVHNESIKIYRDISGLVMGIGVLFILWGRK